MARTARVLLKFSDAGLEDLFDNPYGPLRALMDLCGGTVKAGAKRRCEVRTGHMRDLIDYQVGADAAGVYVDVTSPATSKTGFPYPTVHEGKKVRDRRPHRSLRPALRDLRALKL